MSETPGLFRTADRAWTAAMDTARYAERRGDIVTKAVGAAAPIIVAAELRRLALVHSVGGAAPDDDLEEAYFDGIRLIVAALRARADELDGGAS